MLQIPHRCVDKILYRYTGISCSPAVALGWSTPDSYHRPVSICTPTNPPVISCPYAKAGVSVPARLGGLLDWLSRLDHRHGAQLGGNPWKEPPEAVVKEGMEAVSVYFADLFKEGVAPVSRKMIKVVLVGQEGAGKTR